jgi:hypothetical protein
MSCWHINNEIRSVKKRENYCSICVIFFIHLATVDTLLENGLLLTTPGRKIVLYLRMIVYMNISCLLL